MDWSRDMDIPENQEYRGPSLSSGNCVLDIHGDPVMAQLVIFSDGNHHMALRQAVAAFKEKTSGIKEICFLTTPPGPLLRLIQGDKLSLGNLSLSICPNIFISPPSVLNRLMDLGVMHSHTPFVKNQGSALLVKTGNPKQITRIQDLAQKDITLFISSPESEKQSYTTYTATLKALYKDFPKTIRMITGEAVHHREALEFLASDRADAAILFYHLAKHYSRTFPDQFEMIPLPEKGNQVTTTHAGLIGDGGKFGPLFLDFILSKPGQTIYKDHGLVPIAKP